jgi:hypothetical protein
MPLIRAISTVLRPSRNKPRMEIQSCAAAVVAPAAIATPTIIAQVQAAGLLTCARWFVIRRLLRYTGPYHSSSPVTLALATRQVLP